jgi:POT family proton-dependent oligopeptide transporter
LDNYFKIVASLTSKSNNKVNAIPNNIDKDTLLGHPLGLFVLFFTEMWERFSYYGMRALLVLFLVSELTSGGWGWTREEALKLYATYTGLVYLTPIFGGIIADKLLGHRMTVVIGALLMTLGHASMAFETPFFFYAGLGLLIVGNGAFKPNISTIVGGLYPAGSDKKDSAYTIFYMGINAGAFLGILLCGYIGEKVGWSYGFGLAGIFMFLGMLQFWFGQKIFGDIGLKPKKAEPIIDTKQVAEKVGLEGITRIGLWLGVGAVFYSIMYYYVLPKLFGFEGEWLACVLLSAAVTFIGIVISDPGLKGIEKDRVWVIIILSLFTIFFWMAFEQAGGSMTIFAKDYTHRVLTGGSANAFRWINTILTIAPLAIVTYVLISLFRKTFKDYTISNLFLGLSFVIIWGVAIWMIRNEFRQDASEVPASWFGILNSFFIISFAPLFSKIWESKYNPSAAVKFALGLTLLGLGFGVLAFGSSQIPAGATTASVSMIWLIAAYLLHTLGELTLSPVGLSYVSKLAPAKFVGLMFGFWFLASAIANYFAGWTGSFVDQIAEKYSMSAFFLIYTAIPITAALVLLAMNGMLKRRMHGVE